MARAPGRRSAAKGIPPKRPDGRTLRGRPRPAGAPRSSSRRQAILDAGALLMQQRGFVGTTVEDVTDQLALTKAAFYYYVENKEELLFQIASQTLELADAQVAAIERSDALPERKLDHVIDTFVHLVSERPAFFTVYFQEKGHLAPEHLRAVAKVERRIVQAVERILRQGTAAGSFGKIEPAVAAFGLLGMCFWLYKWYRPDGRLSVEEVSRAFQALAARGYLGPGPVPV